jgi:TIGR03009 family protein
MRRFGLTCTACLILAIPATAQPTNPPAAMPSPERLDALLKSWEQRMAGVESFSTKATRTTLHAVTKKATTFVGDAAFMKSRDKDGKVQQLARVDLTHQDDLGKKDAEKTNFERMFCNGKYIYEYSPKDKLIILHDMPKGDALADNLILAFLRGMKSEDAKKRFALTLTKETEWYGYIYIQPKSDADKQEFSAAQLTIFIKNPNAADKPNLAMMPCRLWYRQPNGTEVTYLFSDIQPNGKLSEDSFVPRQIPGYQVKMANAIAASPEPKPKTVRPQMP